MNIYIVLGSTGNVYEVEIGQRLGCSCRDHIFRKKHCKHILLILLKVFHVNAHSPACHRLYLTREELAQVFENCTPDASVIANQQIQSTLESQLYGKNLPPVKEEGNEDGAKQRPLTTSDCPVCFEEFTEAERSLIVFCKSCGNNIHKACFEAWSTSGRSKITCVYCRAEWHDSKKKKKNNTSKIDTSHLRNQEGYVNVGSLVGMPEVRDVSSYGL
ncbi:hypothetical protein BDA99DRAFT_30879 [Phascolomyces articulosus]|uniref:Uncharacterized protein n=1 Tax=Phascolomyces articulosus TaxID=60185 RepID=A0AAD5K352_9FUNG|nr:hypothetical protein BDA99DRAFT_30879 [Phascolomyces articulosus]